jgi:hypothetical protein
MPEKGMLSPELVAGCAREGLPVVTWVVDDPDELWTLSPLGLYAVCSNRPGALLAAIWESE